MKHKHKKMYYIGGLISLSVLPILLFLYTSKASRNAIRYGSIEIQLPIGGGFRDQFSIPPTYRFRFANANQLIQIDSMRKYSALLVAQNEQSYFMLQIELPTERSIQFVVNVLDFLNENNYGYTLTRGHIATIHYRSGVHNRASEYLSKMPASTNSVRDWAYALRAFVIRCFAKDKLSSVKQIQWHSDAAVDSLVYQDPVPFSIRRTFDESIILVFLMWIILGILSLRRSLTRSVAS